LESEAAAQEAQEVWLEAWKGWVQDSEQHYCGFLRRMLPKLKAEKRQTTTLVFDPSVSPPLV
jgi:bifunctional pyridoxal-dependent enzyme with beta-cystathionase and maltose regulon repressor activities